MRVLLTGAAGFIGAAIDRELRAAGHEVRGVDLMLPCAHGRDAAPPAGVIGGDIRDQDLLHDLLDGVDAVCHQAAMVGLGVDAADAPEYASHNVVGTATLVAAMARRETPALVQASSMVVYGEGRYRCVRHGAQPAVARTAHALRNNVFDPPCPRCGEPLQWLTVDEDAPMDPRNSYAASKVATEHFGRSWAHTTGGRLISLRYHNVYGPGMPRDTPYAGVASIFRSALEVGRAPQVFEDGRQMRDFVHVDDVARANRLALERVIGGRAGVPEVTACNVASGDPHSVGEFATMLSAAMDGPPPQVVGGGRAGDVRHVVADPSAARRLLGFSAQTRFDTGVAEFAHATLR
ncbi:NAD(P)-dependent oxidoreductase [Williamsia sp. CHRR-6]|uniref:NAD-dependent epimerase/dehydratase family protein n=1 Tax=Williamsia sp. CHRR-6 TaxID=2835871 RepID=UPI001BD99674|nr:NAD-dependent epimerase/dehydratase family protein [Williamsia sp. CHRR-6]MBT0566372.1 NAD-dependent epimerase/dehydratase family protein [Williamsia sp. CHRR-6]